jgi:hypothetical protein
MHLYSRFNPQLNEEAPLLDLTFDDQDALQQSEEAERHLAELGWTLDFEPEDLIENRAGYLSAAQAKRLWNSIAQTYWIVLSLLSSGVLILGMVGLSNLPGRVLWLILMFGVIGLALVTAYDMRRQRATFPDRAVHAATLRLNRLSLMLRRWGSDSGMANFTVEGDKKLVAEARLYKTLHPDQEYTAYYVELYPALTNYRIVSIEPTGEWVPLDDNDKPRERPKRKKRKRLT